MDVKEMRFSEILDDVVAGKKATRADWKSKGMFIYYVPPRTLTVSKYHMKETVTDHERLTNTVNESGYMVLYDENDVRVLGWTPSQTDLVSDKWELLK